MSDDPNEMVYVEHDDGDDGTIDQGAWVPRSSLRQWAASNWFVKDPPADQLPPASSETVGDNDPNKMVVMKHDGIGSTARVPYSAVAQHRLSGWYVEGDVAPDNEVQPIVRDGDFDPASVGYKEVIDYLKTADDAERARVIAVEKSLPSPRKSVVNWQPPVDATTDDARGDES